jgi:metal-dependent amidase/aminoacylase/carboxypeptidase family protein
VPRHRRRTRRESRGRLPRRLSPTVNAATEADFVADTVRELHGEHRFAHQPTQLTAAEDFSRVLERVPGAFVLLGACPPDADPTAVADNHSPSAVFDDGVLTDGAALNAALALRLLE